MCCDLHPHCAPWHVAWLRLGLLNVALGKCAAAAVKDHIAARRAALGRDLQSGPLGDAKAYKLLRAPPPRRLVFVAGPDGVPTAAPGDVDHIVTQAWSQVYDGNVPAGRQGVTNMVTAFFAEFAHYTHVAPTQRLPPLQVEEVHAAFRGARRSSPGMDGWRPEELAQMSLEAARRMTDMLNAVEGGKAWPRQFAHAKALFLGKTDSVSFSPLDNRVLLICPAVYRRWGALRLRHLEGWIESWAPPRFVCWHSRSWGHACLLAFCAGHGVHRQAGRTWDRVLY